jgi:hypothetical protein
MLRIRNGEVAYVKYSKAELAEDWTREYKERNFLHKAWVNDHLFRIDLFQQKQVYFMPKKPRWCAYDSSKKERAEVKERHDKYMHYYALLELAKNYSIPVHKAVLERYEEIKAQYEEDQRLIKERDERERAVFEKEIEERLERERQARDAEPFYKGRRASSLMYAWRSGLWEATTSKDKLVVEMLMEEGY